MRLHNFSFIYTNDTATLILSQMSFLLFINMLRFSFYCLTDSAKTVP